MDLSGYTAELVTRFSNPGIRHRLLQIAMDGSQKLPQRLLRPALDRLRQGAMPRHIALVVAAWMRFLQSRDEQGHAYEINDPLAGRLVKLAADAGENVEVLVDALFSVREIFVAALATDPGFRNEVVRAFGLIRQNGIGPAVSATTHP
jgi:fructuronate reductase